MNPLTSEWVQKAEGDFGTASREIRARRAPNYDAVCFHAQQCAEKYLKALLQEEDIPFGKTHNLVILLDLLLPAEPSWEMLRHDMQVLWLRCVCPISRRTRRQGNRPRRFGIRPGNSFPCESSVRSGGVSPPYLLCAGPISSRTFSARNIPRRFDIASPFFPMAPDYSATFRAALSMHLAEAGFDAYRGVTRPGLRMMSLPMDGV
jgi:HEPN domain-containing protein